MRAANPRDAVLRGARASLEQAVQPEYTRIAAMDAPSVLGEGEWHVIDGALGMKSFRGGLKAMHAAGQLTEVPPPLVASALFGALTELGRTLAREGRTGAVSRDEAIQIFTRLFEAMTAPPMK